MHPMSGCSHSLLCTNRNCNPLHTFYMSVVAKMSDADLNAALSLLYDSQDAAQSSDATQYSQDASTPSRASKRRATITSPKKQRRKRNKNADSASSSDAASRLFWADAHVSYMLKLLKKIKEHGSMGEGGFKQAQWSLGLRSSRRSFLSLTTGRTLPLRRSAANMIASRRHMLSSRSIRCIHPAGRGWMKCLKMSPT